MPHRVLIRRMHEPRNANAPTKVRKAVLLKNPAVALPRTLKEDSLIKYPNEEFARNASVVYDLPWLQNRRALFFSLLSLKQFTSFFRLCTTGHSMSPKRCRQKARRGEVLRHQAFPLKDIEIGAGAEGIYSCIKVRFRKRPKSYHL